VKYSIQIKWFLHGWRLSLEEICPGSSRSTLRGVPLGRSYWVQPSVDQKSSKGLPWYHCLEGLKMIVFRHQQFSILVKIHMMQSWYADSNYTIPALPRMYKSEVYQTDVTLGIRSFRCGQGAPDQPNSLLFYKDKESTK